MEIKDESIKEKLDKLIDNFEAEKKKKEFKLPLSVRLQQGKIKRQNYSVVMTIDTNKGVNFKMVQIEDDTIKYKENFYSASAEYILRYRKYPLLIIPLWTMIPFSPSANFKESEEKGMLTAAQKLILTKMKMEVVKSKMKINVGLVIMLIVLAGAAYWALSYYNIV